MFLRLTSSALAICLVTAPAAFSLTPDEVWDGWVKYYSSMGYKLAEGAREQAGETLTIKDVVLTQDNPTSKINMQLGQLVLQGTGDGGVRTTMPDTIPAHIEVTQDKEKPVLLDLTMKLPGAEILSTGDLDNRTDRMTLPTATLTFDKVELPAESRTMNNVASVTATDMVSETVTRGGTAYTSNSTIAKLDYTLDVAEDPGANAEGDQGSIKGKGSLEKLAVDAEVTLPAGGSIANLEENIAKALNDGLTIKGKLSGGAGTHSFDYTSKPKEGTASNGTVAATVGSLAASFDMAASGIGYKVEGTNSETSITDSQLPAPITYKLDKGAFGVMVPISKSDAPSPFSLTYLVSGLTLGDSLWDLADPAKKLPRTPANIDIDVSGLARVTDDLLDPAVMDKAAGGDESHAATSTETPDATTTEAPDAATPTDKPAEDAAKPETDTSAAPDAATETAPDAATNGATDTTAETASPDDEEPSDNPMPFDPVELTINKFAVDALGAKISAEGALKGAAGGSLKTPVGTLHARMEGINKLIDTLVAMGVVKSEQVQGYRMMLAMFTKTTEGSDVMTSDIEFKEDGSILANGQQIK
ncbi:DUF2125 domain-containing protein [Paracoccus suum]|uniref:DUF2125 domain-containing protein n=1 Tax=Paracoccus suum TaxID=2259340 RepID=A0A344PHN7_9RHOB|nr:DUF2125 domain-containing protein [Paracoccus suum]AXC48892.1 DUF2125 domain-containing protein [Paracoccus suum]